MAEWDESKHKRDRAGRFAEQEEKRQSLEKVYNSDLASGTGTQGQVPVPKAVGFNRSKTKHHQRHAAEMGLNEKEYIKRAIEFFNSTSGILYYSHKENKFYRYDKKSMLYVVCMPNGILNTFYSVKVKDFNDLKRQFDMEELC